MATQAEENAAIIEFVVRTVEEPSARQAYLDDPAGAMQSAGLSETSQELLSTGTLTTICAYVGESDRPPTGKRGGDDSLSS